MVRVTIKERRPQALQVFATSARLASAVHTRCALAAADARQKRMSLARRTIVIERTLLHVASIAAANPIGWSDERAHSRPITHLAPTSPRKPRRRETFANRNFVDRASTVWCADGWSLRWPRLEMATSPREQRRTVTGRALRSRQAQGRLSRLATWVRRFVATTHLAVLSRPGPVGFLG